jgi:molybdate transport system substrate-binding protein
MSGNCCVGCIFLLVHGIGAEAADLKGLSAFGMQSVLEDLGPPFERATGHQLAVAFATGGGAVKRVRGGDAADVVITLRQGLDTLVKDGKVPAESVAALARAGMFVAVRQGAPRPDVSSPDALTRALLAPRAIAYVGPASGGASGIDVATVLERLGIASEMPAKTVFPDPKTPAAVGVVVANGEAEIGVHIIQELTPVAGLEIVGPLSGDLQHTVVFSAAIMAGPKAAAVKGLVDFLRTPESAPVIQAKGMEPATP